MRADLQSAAFNHSATYPYGSDLTEVLFVGRLLTTDVGIGLGRNSCKTNFQTFYIDSVNSHIDSFDDYFSLLRC